jgi:hypothetical protein
MEGRTTNNKITRKRLVGLTFLSLAVVGACLAAIHLFYVLVLDKPQGESLRLVGIVALVALSAVALGTYENFKRYWPESSPPPRPRNQRVITALSLASALVAAVAGGAAYAYVQRYMAVGLGLSAAATIGGLLLVRRLREELRE